mgnify:CR=1 FL=1
MKVEKSFDLSAVELMDALKEELLSSCVYKEENPGWANLSREEERHLLALWEVIKPLGQQVEAANEMRFVLNQIKERSSDD